jgi:hypothetical protein
MNPMLKFVVKKTFFDMWDNFLRIALINAGFILLSMLGLYTLLHIDNQTVAAIGLVILVAILVIYAGGSTAVIKEIADYREPGMKCFIDGIRETLISSLVLTSAIVSFGTLIMVAFSYYSSREGLFWTVLWSLSFWIAFIVLNSLSWYFHINSRLETRPLQILRKCFLIFIDNIGFSLFLMTVSIVIIVLSAFLGFMVPGFGTLLLLWNVGLKLRLYKYEYLEKTPHGDRNDIPWPDLLEKDNQKIGKRTLKGMFFPWKE